AANAEVAADVRAAAEAWTGSDDGAVRARGLLVAALLDRGAGVARWHAAARGDRDAGVRAALLAHAPLTGRRAEDEGVLAALLDEIESSADAATRRAALEGLTVRLAAAEIERLALAAARETDAAVRQALVREVAGGGAATPRVIEFLAGAAFDAQGDDLTHGVARAGLEQLEARTPGALDAALMARLRAAAAALTAGPGSDAEVEG
ncbi:MAG: hypothetical protein HYZ53_05885, partial [Planctomycetes bacterium]|nr:hypothetical protein [Planctomycetota bacterium]